MKPKIFISVILLTSLIITGCENDQSTSLSEDDEPISVMTWNIYVGTDVDKILAAQNPQDIPVLAAEAFQLLLATKFSERAEAIAKQIAQYQPHVIGLQEVSLLRRQSPGDAVAGGTTPAEEVLFDYLEILLAAIQSQGQSYKIAGMVQNTDAEIPMVVNVNPLAFDDIRLTDFDVVLARDDVEISRIVEANFDTKVTVPGFGLDILRGYVAVDAKIGKKSYRFVNTHLEPRSSGEQIQLAQAQELVAALQSETLPIILVGDLNTRPPDAQTFQFFESQGFIDIWPLNSNSDNPNGYTTSHDLNLLNQEVTLTDRIDLILVRNENGIDRVEAQVIGDELGDRTVSDLWPSDHAGVVAELRIR